MFIDGGWVCKDSDHDLWQVSPGKEAQGGTWVRVGHCGEVYRQEQAPVQTALRLQQDTPILVNALIFIFRKLSLKEQQGRVCSSSAVSKLLWRHRVVHLAEVLACVVLRWGDQIQISHYRDALSELCRDIIVEAQLGNEVVIRVVFTVVFKALAESGKRCGIQLCQAPIIGEIDRVPG